MLAAQRLTKRTGRLTALADVSFSVRAGEVLGLIGPNGSGKTTLFECLAGVLPAGRGHASASATGRSSRRERALHLFYLPDASRRGRRRRSRWALEFTVGFFGGRADVAAEVVDRLGPRAAARRRRSAQLSKGQRKRALLAIGLLTPQPVLLADEPFDGLDLRQSREVGGGAAGRTPRAGARCSCRFIRSRDAARVCDRFVLLSGGRVCGEGTLDELARSRRRPRASQTATDLEEVFLALT